MIIINAKVITWELPNQILTGKAVAISGSTIKEIATQSEILQKYPEDEIIDADGQWLMPGLICAHTHFYGTFSRGLYIPPPAPADFPEILQKLWWPLDQSLQEKDVKYSALICMIDAIKHGTTTLFDHHASPNFIEGSLDVIEEAFIHSGVRGVVCYEVTDRGGKEKTEKGIQENLRMIKKLSNASSEHLVRATFGMHASLTLSEETLTRSRDLLPKSSGIHIHTAEHWVDEYDAINKSGLRVIDRLNKHGFLGEKSIFAHGVHLDHAEIEQLVQTKTWLSHQPRSNLNNAVGLGDIDSQIRAGLKVCLGNDGFSNTMWDEWRTCYLAHKGWHRDPRRMGANTVVDMAIYNNSDLTRQFFSGERIGRIEPGAKADLILVDFDAITELTVDNLPWQIIFGFRDSMVTTTIVNGKILMKDRKLTTVDEKEINQKARELSKVVWQRYLKQF
jgi:putative selenium metabolism protein SsnA